MKKNILLKLLIVVILVIIIILLILINLNESEEENIFLEPEDVVEVYSDEWENVSNIYTFNAVTECINAYFNYMTNGNLNGLYNILDLDYIEAQEISQGNIGERMEIIPDQEFLVLKMEEKRENQDTAVFLVEGKVSGNEEISYFGIKVEYQYYKFSIMPLEEKDYTFTISNTVDISEENIYNNFELETITRLEEAEIYYNNIRYLLLNDTESIFKMLDLECSETKFNNSYEDFEQYINSIQDSLADSMISNYDVEYPDSKIVYYILDNQNNYFVVTVSGVLDYTLSIQDYNGELDV